MRARWVAFAILCPSLASASPPSPGEGEAQGEASPARSEPAPEKKGPRTGLWGPRFPGRPWEIQVALDYSRGTAESYGLEVDPYTLGLVLSAGYFWPGGFGLSLNGAVYKGSTIPQTYAPPLTELVLDINGQSQLFDLGISVSYDQPLGPVLLRYALGTNLGVMSWDFGSLPYTSIGGYAPPMGSAVVLSLDPGLSLLWPIGVFFASARIHSRISFSPELPNALGGLLGMGVRF